MTMHQPNSKHQSGMTLVELMIAMVLSLTLSGAIISVFVNNSHSFKQDENVLRLQDDARHALQQVAFEISMAGHYAELLVPDAVTPDDTLSIGVDCGPAGELNWMYRTTESGSDNAESIIAIDNVTNSIAGAAHSCFAAGEVKEGTDVVVVKRVAGAEAAATTPGKIYLRTNGTVGLLYQAPLPASPTIAVPVPRADWEYRPSIFYVREFANAVGDGIPTLCKKVLQGAAPNMTTECLATGIEDLQIEYGIDTTEDGNPNMYLPNPTMTQMQSVVSARIALLARTAEIDTRYTNQKTFSISNAPDYTPDDSFHRRVFSTTVSIQNIRSFNMMGY
jgi:type IV pilus assembly protein PilW